MLYRVHGRIQGAPLAPPLKLENIWLFGIKSLFFTRNTPKIFAPPFSRRNFIKRAPLTWNPGSAPGVDIRTHKVSGDRLWLHRLVIYTTTNNSFGVNQKLKMAISHGPSWHCSFIGHSLSSLEEALKTMNAIKFGRYAICQIMHKWCNSVINVYTYMAAKASIEISDNFSWTGEQIRIL